MLLLRRFRTLTASITAARTLTAQLHLRRAPPLSAHIVFVPAPPPLPRSFSHDARAALLDRVIARIAEQRHDALRKDQGLG